LYIGNDFVFIPNQFIYGFNKKTFNIFFSKVRRFAVMLEFIIAAVDSSAVLVVGMPNFGSIPAAAVATFYFRREDTDPAVPLAAMSTFFYFFLH
jgi:hypothetical protein